ncbi:ABC transporter ATP-binding protein [Paenibacillus sp. N4]|uniref:ABC transporter ATP-binding protein n=1 Tax=Paenibacillus vietnamensis TaxID=2590547 RepID=UPI001CD14053|nr:ABC transporter ATP-binding protein [Paenibacillus vietnamensis]MCA0754707.1 ABC transporter ATP-binding protein [Paenibacillus vietnamensis]
MTYVLTLQGVGCSFSKESGPVLSGVSLDVRAGEFVSVVGASGSGKSTLFKLIAGLLEPDCGEIRLRGAKAGGRLGKVSYMPQKDLLLPWRTVLANCLLPLEIARSRTEPAKREITARLKDFGLAGLEHAYPDELSGGMRQRVAFLRTIAGGQELLLLDEPFGALDAMTKRDMQRWLLGLWSELGKTVLFITHDLEEALLLSDRIYMMSGTGQGGSGVREMIVPLPRPRRYEMVYEAGFAGLRQELERRLHA